MSEFVRIECRGRDINIEYDLISPQNSGPLVVFLHEGLGSLAMWRGFPRALCEAVGCRGLVYSRLGYGRSSSLWPDRQWPIDFMHFEGREILPRVLAALDIDAATDPPVLVGHSDGASIALICASTHPQQVSGIVAIAPHIMVEAVTVKSIASISDEFLYGDLPHRLGKYHSDVQGVFWGWATVWLRPQFLDWDIRPLLGSIKCPMLLIQGFDDQYGSMAQIDGILAALPRTSALRLSHCAHSPHIDQAAAVTAAIGRFLLTIRPDIQMSIEGGVSTWQY
jgi:pimeloyl-ACP methyl ester carboxylesterase